MFKKYLIFIVLIFNYLLITGFNQNPLPPKTYHIWHERATATIYLRWDKSLSGSIDIEITVNGKTTQHNCPSKNGTWESRLPTEPKPQIKVFHRTDKSRELMELSKIAIPTVSDGLCVQWTTETMKATHQKNQFTFIFDMTKSCNLPDTILVRTRLYWSKDAWVNLKTDSLLKEQLLPFGKQIQIEGIYNMDKSNKKGFLFLEIVDEHGKSLRTSEAVAVD
ncbi:MAG: hypothetical protein RLZZ628_2940 [Bacteroidota bacterium]|jgi:hypothetical protein